MSTVKAKSFRWHYVGDINPEYGGYWFNLHGLKWGFVDVIRVNPCSDAGGPDNVFWIEALTVNMPETDTDKNKVLSCSGLSVETVGTGTQARNALINACIAYGKYDMDSIETLRIGPVDTYYTPRSDDDYRVDKVLRAGSSLANYIRREYLTMCEGTTA